MHSKMMESFLVSGAHGVPKQLHSYCLQHKTHLTRYPADKQKV